MRLSGFFSLKISSDLLHLVGAVAIISTLAGFFGSWWWVLELFSHFRVQYAAMLLPVIGFLLIKRRRQAAIAYSGALLVNLWLIAPLYLASPAPPMENSPTLRILSFNVLATNKRFADILDYVREADADVVALLEVRYDWAQALAKADLPYHVIPEYRPDMSGIVLLTREKPIMARVVDVADVGPPSIEAVVRMGDREVSLLATHPSPPGSAHGADIRDRQLKAVAAWARGQPRPVVVFGDLNTTPWSHVFRALERDGNLLNSQRGYGITPTWPSMIWPLRIAIDHCLYDPRLTTLEREIGPSLGSDHYALHVTLAFAALGDADKTP